MHSTVCTNDNKAILSNVFGAHLNKFIPFCHCFHAYETVNTLLPIIFRLLIASLFRHSFAHLRPFCEHTIWRLDRFYCVTCHEQRFKEHFDQQMLITHAKMVTFWWSSIHCFIKILPEFCSAFRFLIISILLFWPSICKAFFAFQNK